MPLFEKDRLGKFVFSVKFLVCSGETFLPARTCGSLGLGDGNIRAAYRPRTACSQSPTDTDPRQRSPALLPTTRDTTVPSDERAATRAIRSISFWTPARHRTCS